MTSETPTRPADPSEIVVDERIEAAAFQAFELSLGVAVRERVRAAVAAALAAVEGGDVPDRPTPPTEPDEYEDGTPPHPLRHLFVCPTIDRYGICVCGAPLPPQQRWIGAGGDWQRTQCPACGRGYVDEESFIRILDDGLDYDDLDATPSRGDRGLTVAKVRSAEGASSGTTVPGASASTKALAATVVERAQLAAAGGAVAVPPADGTQRRVPEPPLRDLITEWKAQREHADNVPVQNHADWLEVTTWARAHEACAQELTDMLDVLPDENGDVASGAVAVPPADAGLARRLHNAGADLWNELENLRGVWSERPNGGMVAECIDRWEAVAEAALGETRPAPKEDPGAALGWISKMACYTPHEDGRPCLDWHDHAETLCASCSARHALGAPARSIDAWDAHAAPSGVSEAGANAAREMFDETAREHSQVQREERRRSGVDGVS